MYSFAGNFRYPDFYFQLLPCMKDTVNTLFSSMYPQPSGQGQGLMPQYGTLGNVGPGQVPPMQQVGVPIPGPPQPVIPPNGRGEC